MRAPGAPNTAYSRQIMSQNHGRNAPAINSTKKSSLFEVPSKDSRSLRTDTKERAPKTLLDWARQAALQIHRWLPDRYIVLVADSAFAAIEFLAAVRNHVCVVTRLRLDANLFDFP